MRIIRVLFLLLVGCVSDENPIDLLHEDRYSTETDLDLISNRIIAKDSIEIHVDTIRELLARKFSDSITIQFSASFFNPYRLNLKIIGDRYQIDLKKSNCMTTHRYNIIDSKLGFLQREYEVNDTIKGIISFKADYIEEDSREANLEEFDVELSGRFSILLRDSSFTYWDLDRETRNTKFDNLLKAPDKIGNVLNMSGLGLTEIPIEKLKSIKKIDTIDLSQNSLKQIEVDKLKELGCIKYLDLSSNAIESIPQRIAELNCLEELDLYNNQISSIPKELYGLGRLKQLKLSRNQLKMIPPGVSSLQQIEYFGFGDNPIKRLPDEFQRMKKLKKLSIPEANEIEYIPKGILRLARDQFRYRYKKPEFTKLSNYEELREEIEEVRRQ